MTYSFHIFPVHHIVTCWMVHVTNNYGIRRMIGFINTSVTHALLITVTSKQYSSIVDLHFTVQFFIFTNNLPRLPATDNCRELSGVLPVSRYINSAPTAQKTQLCCLLALTAQKTSHAFFIVVCRPITAELRSDAEMFIAALRSSVRNADLIESSFSVEMCLRSRCLATVCVNTPHYINHPTIQYCVVNY
jgi:hypothetical protein